MDTRNTKALPGRGGGGGRAGRGGRRPLSWTSLLFCAPRPKHILKGGGTPLPSVEGGAATKSQSKSRRADAGLATCQGEAVLGTGVFSSGLLDPSQENAVLFFSFPSIFHQLSAFCEFGLEKFSRVNSWIEQAAQGQSPRAALPAFTQNTFTTPHCVNGGSDNNFSWSTQQVWSPTGSSNNSKRKKTEEDTPSGSTDSSRTMLCYRFFVCFVLK